MVLRRVRTDFFFHDFFFFMVDNSKIDSFSQSEKISKTVLTRNPVIEFPPSAIDLQCEDLLSEPSENHVKTLYQNLALESHPHCKVEMQRAQGTDSMNLAQSDSKRTVLDQDKQIQDLMNCGVFGPKR